MFDVYKDIFDQRAALYHSAMKQFPLARQQEFEWTIKSLAIQPGDIICDIPSGGGYLKNFVNVKDCFFHFLETCESFAACSPKGRDVKTQVCEFEKIPLMEKSIDSVVSLAALHHIENREEVFREFSRILKPGGKLVIVDVEKGTNTAGFLNTFVDQYNSMGHRGKFIDDEVINQLQNNQLKLSSIERPKLNWCFDNHGDMITFCRNLFGIDQANDDELASGIATYLNPSIVDGCTQLEWQLIYITLDMEG